MADLWSPWLIPLSVAFFLGLCVVVGELIRWMLGYHDKGHPDTGARR